MCGTRYRIAPVQASIYTKYTRRLQHHCPKDNHNDNTTSMLNIQQEVMYPKNKQIKNLSGGTVGEHHAVEDFRVGKENSKIS
jgi:plasmid replication initiation protein